MTAGTDPVAVEYDAPAPAYDTLTRGYDYERWLAAAGLRIVDVPGQRTGVVLDAELDETRHAKALFFAHRSEQEGGDDVEIIRP
jgi:hypothetical protein